MDPNTKERSKNGTTKSSREPVCYSSDFAAGFRVAKSMAIDAVASVRNQTQFKDDPGLRLNKAVDAVASIEMPEDE